jgi:alginate O-acetyltransferase complex protein AlgJ
MMKRRSPWVLGCTVLCLMLVPAFNLLLAPAPVGADCCSKERLFNQDFLLRWVSQGLYPLGISVDPSQAVIGRDDWLYLGDAFELSVSRARAAGGVNDLNLGAVYAQGAQRWAEYLRGKGVQSFQVMVAPNKGSIYPEHLPDWAALGTPGMTDLVFQGLSDTVFHDLRPPLRAARRHDSVSQYFRFDTHWNEWGASIGFRAFADRLRPQLPELRWPADADYQIQRTDEVAGGDLASFLRLSKALSEKVPVLAMQGLPAEVVQTRYGKDERVDPAQLATSRVALSHPVQTHNPAALNRQRVLWLTDSFGWQMRAPMYASFSDVVQLHWRDALRNGGNFVRLVDEWKPDLVVVTVVERSFLGQAFASFLGYAPVGRGAPARATPQAGVAQHFEVTGLRGLVREGGHNHFRVTADTASLTLGVPQAVRVDAPFSLALTCVDGAAAVPVQVFWKPEHVERFHRDLSMKFLHIGAVTEVDVRGPDGLGAPPSIKDIRVDFWGQGACRRFRLDGLTIRATAGATLSPSGDPGVGSVPSVKRVR